MSDNNKQPTHKAWAYRRTGRKSGKLLEVGTGRIDRENNQAHVYLDRTPLNGFSGYLLLSPADEPAPYLEPLPQRPGEDDDEG